MKIITTILCIGLLLGGSLGSPRLSPGPQADVAREEFWTKFKTAVIKKDKATVASLSQYPIGMPYGFRSIRNKTQLISRYREIFNHEGDAAVCFKTARPEGDAAKPKEFSVACPNGAGDPVVIYSFVLTPSGWRFRGLDNLNE